MRGEEKGEREGREIRKGEKSCKVREKERKGRRRERVEREREKRK